MRPCSLLYCARATECSALWRRSYTHGSRLLSSYERPSLSGGVPGIHTSNIEEHADRTPNHEWTLPQSTPSRDSGNLRDQALNGSQTPFDRVPQATSDNEFEGSAEYFEALQSSADSLPPPTREKRSPPKHLIEAARTLAVKSARPWLGDEFLRRDAFLMAVSLYREQGEPPGWSWNIHRLHVLTHPEISNSDKWKQLKVRYWNVVEGWVKDLTEEGDKPTTYHLAWRKLPLDLKRKRWGDIMLWLLLNSPTKALMFLRATANTTPGPPFSVVSDSFNYLYKHYRQLFSSGPLKQQFEESLQHCLHPRTWPAVGTAQNGLRLYFQFCPQSSLATTFLDMVYRRRLTSSTGLLLYLADRFTQASDLNFALFCLKLAYRRGKKGASFQHIIRIRCYKLLLLDDISERQGVRDFMVLRGILDMGIRLNRSMYNIVLANALRIGDYHLAWDIYGLMKNERVGVDSYTYLVLLDDALRRGDTESVGYVLRIIKSDPQLRTQKQLTSKRMHAVQTLSQDVICERWTYADTFNAMLELYCEVHDKQPLIDLGMIAPEEDVSSPREDISPPSPHALTMMISAFVKAQSDPAAIRHVLKRFYRHIREGHQSIAPLAETDHTWNAFLTGMASHANLLGDCVQIVEIMLRPFDEEVTLKGKGRIIHKATPTVQTWTILLSAFLWSRQPQTALTVRDMMLKRGVEFNQVTWNVMVRGFASMQMVDETAAALRMMERENWPQDAHTVKAVSMIHDQERLRWALERFDKEDAVNRDTDPQSQESEYVTTGADGDANSRSHSATLLAADREPENLESYNSTARSTNSGASLPTPESTSQTKKSTQPDYTSSATLDPINVYREEMEYDQASRTNVQ